MVSDWGLFRLFRRRHLRLLCTSVQISLYQIVGNFNFQPLLSDRLPGSTSRRCGWSTRGRLGLGPGAHQALAARTTPLGHPPPLTNRRCGNPTPRRRPIAHLFAGPLPHRHQNAHAASTQTRLIAVVSGAGRRRSPRLQHAPRLPQNMQAAVLSCPARDDEFPRDQNNITSCRRSQAAISTAINKHAAVESARHDAAADGDIEQHMDAIPC